MQPYDRTCSDTAPISATARELMEEELAAIHGGAGTPTLASLVPNLSSLGGLTSILGANTSGNNNSSANSLPGLNGLAQLMGPGGTL